MCASNFFYFILFGLSLELNLEDFGGQNKTNNKYADSLFEERYFIREYFEGCEGLLWARVLHFLD